MSISITVNGFSSEVFRLNFGLRFFFFFFVRHLVFLLLFLLSLSLLFSIPMREHRETSIVASGGISTYIYIPVQCTYTIPTQSQKLKTRVSHFYRPGQSEIYCS